jgi:hypothetical protein
MPLRLLLGAEPHGPLGHHRHRADWHPARLDQLQPVRGRLPRGVPRQDHLHLAFGYATYISHSGAIIFLLPPRRQARTILNFITFFPSPSSLQDGLCFLLVLLVQAHPLPTPTACDRFNSSTVHQRQLSRRPPASELPATFAHECGLYTRFIIPTRISALCFTPLKGACHTQGPKPAPKPRKQTRASQAHFIVFITRRHTL